MTRKDYQRIAGALHKAQERAFDRGPIGQRSAAAWGVGVAADAVADVLAADNPRFDRNRFLEAVASGLDGGVRL